MKREHIARFVRDVEGGKTPEWGTLEMLAAHFGRWLKGADARTLFPKARGGGPVPKPATSHRQYRMALAVERLCLAGQSRTDAIGTIADRFKAGDATVRAAVTKHGLAAKKHAADMAAAAKATAR